MWFCLLILKYLFQQSLIHGLLKERGWGIRCKPLLHLIQLHWGLIHVMLQMVAHNADASLISNCPNLFFELHWRWSLIICWLKMMKGQFPSRGRISIQTSVFQSFKEAEKAKENSKNIQEQQFLSFSISFSLSNY